MNYIDEKWETIPGYEGLYEASNKGRIRSVKRKAPRILTQTLSKDGYYVVNLSLNGKQKLFYVHRLIALTYIPNPNNKPTVDHKNRIKTDNRIENLRWATMEQQNENKPERNSHNPDVKFKVRNIEEDLIFSNCAAAARWIFDKEYSNGRISTISEKIRKVCRKEPSYKTAYGYTWEFVRGDFK